MHILRLEIQNIRAIEHVEIDLRLAGEGSEPRRRLLLLGGNGTGKTSLLCALAHLYAELSGDRTDADHPGSPRLGAGDVRLAGASDSGPVPEGRIELDGYVTHDEYERLAQMPGARRTVECRTALGKLVIEHIVPARELRASLDIHVMSASDNARIPEQAFIRELLRFARTPPCVLIPADRGALNDKVGVPVDRLNEFSPRARCLEHTRERFQMLPSLLALAHVAPRLNDPDGMVARMWKVLHDRFPEMPRPVDVRGLQLQFETRDGRVVALAQLSDGQRALLLLFGELALRNPANGVVLIDEIEQHLHPRWQRGIVEALPDFLPSTQFIMTTQAPYVAASAPDDVFVLGDWQHDGPQA